MRKVLLTLLILASMVASINATEYKFGDIAITPYVCDNDLTIKQREILTNKLSQIILNNGLLAGEGHRFVLTPKINILEVATTSTIPQKVSVKALLTFYVGDGVDGKLYGSKTLETVGVGDDKDGAILSALRKIDVNDPLFTVLLGQATDAIKTYYEAQAPSLLKDARSAIACGAYKKAIEQLMSIPTQCSYFEEAQELLAKCGARIIERDNNDWLMKAKSAWSSHPNQEGADLAYNYLSNIVTPSSKIIKETEQLNRVIETTLKRSQEREDALKQLRLSKEAEIEKEQIRASAQTASALFGSLPRLVYNIFSWF